MSNKFLNQNGVSILWNRIGAKFAEKEYVDGKVSNLQEQIDALQPDDGTGNAELLQRINANEQAIAKLNAESGEGSVAQVAADCAAAEVAKVVAGASTDFDTLKEIADWIANDTTGAAGMANDIDALEALVGSISVATQIANAIDTALKQDGVDKYALASSLTALTTRVAALEVATVDGLSQAEIEAATPLS